MDPSEFPELPLDSMNEADVRAEILDPLLRRLGYVKGGEASIEREHKLSYPYLFLGRKKPGKDLRLRGNADYTLQVGNHARWTLEAKPPSEPLDEDVLQQAWSYAIHPEVQASYFAVCNGRLFELYQTSAPWGAAPLLRLAYEELGTKFEQLKAWLGPAQIARKHPSHLPEAGKPLGGNLRAFERVASGFVSYEKHVAAISIPMLDELQIAVEDGVIRRDSGGKIRADLLTRGPFRGVQEKINDMGLQVQVYSTDDEYLSVDPAKPTVFRFKDEQLFDWGMNPDTYQPMPLPAMRVLVSATALGHLDGNLFAGRFEADMVFISLETLQQIPVKSVGHFQFRLA
jgi:hypothetical protein